MHDFLIALAYVGLVLAPAVAAAQVNDGTRPQKSAEKFPHPKNTARPWWRRR